MSIATKFLGWDRPVLAAVADELTALADDGGQIPGLPPTWDLSDVLVVLPTQRAGRRLTEILADAAQSPRARRILVPPATATAASIVSAMLHDPSVCASHLEVLSFWSRVMDRMPETVERAGIRVPERASLGVRLRWAEIPARLHQELSVAGLRFADIARCLGRRSSLGRRWTALAELQNAFTAALHDAALEDPSDATVLTREALRLRPYRTLVLAAVPALGSALAGTLESVPQDVLAMIHAPETEAGALAPDGRLRLGVWGERMVDIPDDRITAADDTLDQAASALRIVAEHCAHLAPDEIALCLGHASLAVPVRTAFAQAGLRVHSAPGMPVDRSRPVRLLRAISAFAMRPAADELAALLRHPDVESRVLNPRARAHVLSDLDEYRRVHIPADMRPKAHGTETHWRSLDRSVRMIERTIAPIRETARPLAEWPEGIGAMLGTVYGHVEADESQSQGDALECLARALDQMALLGRTPELDQPVSGVDAIAALIQLVEGDAVPEPPREQALEMIDWVELLHDDAPAAVLLGVNDGNVPANPPDEPFLTDSLRNELGLAGTEHMRAQAAYALTAKLHSCSSTHVMFGRKSADGSPIAPSRLLYACPTGVALRRARVFLCRDSAATTPPETPFCSSDCTRILAPAPAGELAPPVRLSVTAFRDYLACPYRFYLKRVLRLEAPTEPSDELDPLEFGSLLHEVVSRFGREGPTGSVAPNEIAQFLLDCLSELARERFARLSSPAVAIQLAHARARLERLATWHSARVQQGWLTRSEWVEVECEGDLEVDCQTFRIHGRIDRIDYSADEDAFLVLDYKTSEKSVKPDASHRSGPPGAKRWIDLQLPLYRLIAPCREAGRIHLGYVNLGAEPDDPVLALADWDQQVLANADQTIAGVIRNIRDGVFWPPSADLPSFKDGYEPICLDRCLERAELLRRSSK